MAGLEALLPEGLPAWAALLMVAASFLTSAVTASFGVGGGVAMLAMMGLFLPVAALIPVHGAVQLGSNTGRAWHQRSAIRNGILLPFAIGSVLGALVGAAVVIQMPDAPLKIALGLFVIYLAWFSIPGIGHMGPAGLSVASSLTAVLTMVVGATGPLVSSVLSQLIADDRRALVATHAAAMTLQHALKVVVFGAAGFAFAAWLPLIAAMVATGYLGTIHGSRLLERLPEAAFRRWFRIGLTLLALDLVRQGVVQIT